MGDRVAQQALFAQDGKGAKHAADQPDDHRPKCHGAQGVVKK
jgi:hypothetical protein